MINELFPLVNESGQTIGCASRNQCHNGSQLLHPVVHLHVFNAKGELLLQKRSMNKDIQPGKWDTAVGGHIEYGEKIEDALQREAQEELNITDFTPIFLQSYIFESDIEREKVYSYQTTYNQPICFNSEEIEDIRFWNMKEISQNIGKLFFTPNFEYEFRLFDFR